MFALYILPVWQAMESDNTARVGRLIAVLEAQRIALRTRRAGAPVHDASAKSAAFSALSISARIAARAFA